MLCSYLDFSKAFNSLLHTCLLIKLRAYGICGDLYNCSWLCDYLTERKQQVVLNGESSSWTTIISAVPQGSVLGPLLFSLFVNNLAAIYCKKSSSSYITLYLLKFIIQLQQDLDNLYKWSQDWQLCFDVANQMQGAAYRF